MLTMISKRGKYGWYWLMTFRYTLIFLIPVTAALGSYLFPLKLGIVTLYGFRIMVFLVAILSPIFLIRIEWLKSIVSRLFITLGSLWISWGTLSILWAPDWHRAILDVLHVIFGYAVVFSLLNLRAYTSRGLLVLSKGWLGAFMVTMVVAIWEIISGRHLPSSFTEQTPYYAQLGVVASTFGNPNNYGAFLVLAFPFMLLLYLWETRFYFRILYFAFLILWPFLIMLSASRLALIGFGVEVLTFGVLYLLSFRRIPSSLVVYIFFLALAGIFLDPEFRLYEKIYNIYSEIDSGGSIVVRVNLALNALWMIYKTSGRGVGAGGFEIIHEQGSVPYWTDGIINPHNFWLEILSEYGIIIFLLFVTCYFVLFYLSFKKLLNKKHLGKERVVNLMVVVALAGYFFAAITNSSYLEQPTNWVFLASILSMFIYSSQYNRAN